MKAFFMWFCTPKIQIIRPTAHGSVTGIPVNVSSRLSVTASNPSHSMIGDRSSVDGADGPTGLTTKMLAVTSTDPPLLKSSHVEKST
jgi:hypothetical protein